MLTLTPKPQIWISPVPPGHESPERFWSDRHPEATVQSLLTGQPMPTSDLSELCRTNQGNQY